MLEALAEEDMVVSQESEAVEGGAGEVVCYFAAELAGEH